MVESSLASVRARADTGLLFLDFRWKGRRYRRQTTLADTPANRERLEKVLVKIQKQIEAGAFDYAAFFPDSTSATTREQGGAQAAPMDSPQRAVPVSISPNFDPLIRP